MSSIFVHGRWEVVKYDSMVLPMNVPGQIVPAEHSNKNLKFTVQTFYQGMTT